MSKLSYGFSKIKDGNMAFAWGDSSQVITNREQFLKSHGLELSKAILMNVERHGSDIYEVTDADRGKGAYEAASAPVVDAMVTSEPGLPLLVLTGDCYPIIIYDEENGALGLVHAGWRGVHQKLCQKVIERMGETYSSVPSRLQVVMGPGIAADSYIMQDVQQWAYPEWRPYLTKLNNGMTRIDLPGYIAGQCKELGIKEASIRNVNIDTAKDERYFSHYRAIRGDETEGRLMTFAVLNEK